MRVVTAFNRILRVPGAWVTGVAFTDEGVVVSIRAKARRHRCPCGWSTAARYDQSRRRWRHLDFASMSVWLEADIDARMKRTAGRPIPAGRLRREDARDFGVMLAVASVLIMGLAVHWLAAALLALSIVYYAVFYTLWLKPRTPQNIVIGGGAGAFPPLIGWVAVTGEVTAMPLILFAIIFLWTPPHFWALALFVKSDYANAGIPMLPVVKGERTTRRQILAYSLVLLPVALAPWAIGGTGAIYGMAALMLSLAFVALSVPVGLRTSAEGDAMTAEKRLFKFSILYLFALFAVLVVDRMLVGATA